MKEIWKPAIGFENFYEVSNLGNARSVKRNGTNGRVLSRVVDGYGYELCCFMVLGKRKNVKIHRIVAQTFIPNPENKPTVNHIDNDRRNNSVSNLEWATWKENCHHMIKQKRHVFGEKMSKLTNQDVLDIRAAKTSGVGELRKLREKYNVSESVILDIRKGKTWKHLL